MYTISSQFTIDADNGHQKVNTHAAPLSRWSGTILFHHGLSESEV